MNDIKKTITVLMFVGIQSGLDFMCVAWVEGGGGGGRGLAEAAQML